MYRVELAGRVIGKTALESADPPMGVVMGKIVFTISECPYDFIKAHCEKNGIQINEDDGDLGLIDTQNIPELAVCRGDGLKIEGEPGASISGLRDDGYDITIIGIPYPFYENEFPHHRAAYDRKFAMEKDSYDSLNDYGVGRATTPVGGGGGLLKIIIGWFRR